MCVFELSASNPLHSVTHSSSGYNLARLDGLWGPQAKLASEAPGTRVAGPQPHFGLQNSNLSLCRGLPRPLKLLMASSHQPILNEWSTPTFALSHPLFYSHTLFLLSAHSSFFHPPFFPQGKIPSWLPLTSLESILLPLTLLLILLFSIHKGSPVSIFIFLSYLHLFAVHSKALKSVSSSTLFPQLLTSSCISFFNSSSPYLLFSHFLIRCFIFLPLPSFLHPSLPALDLVPRVLCVPHTFLWADWLCLHWQCLFCAWTAALQKPTAQKHTHMHENPQAY